MAKLVNRILTEEPEICFDLPFSAEEQESLRTLAHSKKVSDRKLCADWLAWAADPSANRPLVIELADILIPDRNNDVRWNVLTIALSPKLHEWELDELWPLVVRWGSVKNKDIRMGVGICVLEHILELNYDEYFKRSRQLIEGGNRRFGLTLSKCDIAVRINTPAHAEAFDAFVAPFIRQKRKQSSETAVAV